jgi:hypothetical protein
MNEQPSYVAPPGNRWGSGSASVLGYLLRDLARKPNVAPPTGSGFGVPPAPLPPPRAR